MRLKFGFGVILLLFFVAAPACPAQAPVATAVQRLALSAFGGVDGTYTGLSNGKNLAITAGVDLRVYTWRRYMVSAEVRGTTPIHDGPVDGQKNVLAGAKVDRIFGRVDPYADILIGRGLIDYESGGYLNPSRTLIYTSSPSTVMSPGVGVDLNLDDRFAIKLDAQLQHWDTPVTTSGTLWAKALMAGVVYRFDFNRHPHYGKGE